MKKHQQLTKHQAQRLAPVVAFELTGTAVAVADITTAKKFKRGSKLIWLALAFLQPIGPWLYFLFGQSKENSK